MDLSNNDKYYSLTDRQIVKKILDIPHNEEAAVFLIYSRYVLLLRSIYNSITKDSTWFEDCLSEIFIHLKGKNRDWHTLSTFEWRSTLGCWLKGVAKNKFLEVLPKLIENRGFNVSLDNDDSDKPKVQIPDGGEESYERRQRKVMLMEAIGQLRDDDQRFVILKRLEGYNSKEIAILLQKKWHKHGIKKYNNKKELVVPDAAYVDVRTQRAKENLKKIIVVLK